MFFGFGLCAGCTKQNAKMADTWYPDEDKGNYQQKKQRHDGDDDDNSNNDSNNTNRPKVTLLQRVNNTST